MKCLFSASSDSGDTNQQSPISPWFTSNLFRFPTNISGFISSPFFLQISWGLDYKWMYWTYINGMDKICTIDVTWAIWYPCCSRTCPCSWTESWCPQSAGGCWPGMWGPPIASPPSCIPSWSWNRSGQDRTVWFYHSSYPCFSSQSTLRSQIWEGMITQDWTRKFKCSLFHWNLETYACMTHLLIEDTQIKAQ